MSSQGTFITSYISLHILLLSYLDQNTRGYISLHILLLSYLDQNTGGYI